SLFDLAKLSHINIAFANPRNGQDVAINDSDEHIASLVAAAHAAGVKVLIAIGGGGNASGVVERIAPAKMQDYVKSIAAYLDAHDLDGLDVDLEGDAVNDDYGPFIDAASGALAPKKKLLTAAIATYFSDKIPDKAFSQMDFVNVMSYDICGS